MAAIYQSCYIIKEIAWTGKFNEKDLEILISAIFITNPSSVYNVFNNIRHLDTGFKFLKDQLNGNNVNEEAKEYFSALVQLSKGLEKNETITAKIQEELLVLKSSFSNEEIEKLQKKVAEKYGYDLVDHKLELYGVKKKP